MPPSPRTPPRRTQAQRSSETIAAFTEAALEIIAEKGMKGLTLGAVGARAGVSSTLMFYHFGSKSGLIRHLLDTALETLLRAIGSPDLQDLNGLFDWLDEMPRRVQANSVRVRGHQVMLAEGASSGDPDIRDRIEKFNHVVRGVYADCFANELKKRGGKASLDPQRLAAVYLGALRGIMSQWILEGETFDLKGAAQELKELLKSRFESGC